MGACVAEEGIDSRFAPLTLSHIEVAKKDLDGDLKDSAPKDSVKESAPKCAISLPVRRVTKQIVDNYLEDASHNLLTANIENKQHRVPYYAAMLGHPELSIEGSALYPQAPACKGTPTAPLCELLDPKATQALSLMRCSAITCTAPNSSTALYDVKNYFSLTSRGHALSKSPQSLLYRMASWRGEVLSASDFLVNWKHNFRPTAVTLTAGSTQKLTATLDELLPRGIIKKLWKFDHTFDANGTITLSRGDRRMNVRVIFPDLLDGAPVEATFRIQDVNQIYTVDGRFAQEQNIYAVISNNGLQWSGDCAPTTQ